MTEADLEARIEALDQEIGFVEAWRQLWGQEVVPEAVTCAAYTRLMRVPQVTG